MRDRIHITFLPLLFLLACHARTSNIDAPDAISELTSIEIGGMEQWILIRAKDRSNPVLLWLHGGPGAAQMSVHRAFNQELEEEFVVVQWDQRGAGKSNPRKFDEGTMTPDRFIEDVHEVTQYLKQRFDQEKIFLIGHSWGTQPGILTVQRYPENYHAYISVAQVVHPERSEEISYAWLKKQVNKHGSRRQKRNFKTLGPPCYDEHSRYVRFAKMKDLFGGGMDLGMVKLAWISFGASEYTPGDYVKWLRGANRGSGPMWDELRGFDLFREVPELKVPVWFISGSHDYNTPAALVEEYFEFLDAPFGKHFLLMEKTAHSPFMGDPERFNREIVRIKKSIPLQVQTDE
jgi:pimeloyl-ACP methyl ester carboxylesterase